jgi:hypothetical protein
MELLAAGKRGELAALAMPQAAGEIAETAAAIGAGYDRHEVVASARQNNHYYVKARLHGKSREPFTVQFRLGWYEGRWMLWEMVNLSGRRGAWTR